jgi:hypothetical protein
MFVNVTRPAGERKHTCPCCEFRTLDRRGANEICPVCLWEDTGQDDHDADTQRNGPLFDSLTGARFNFKKFGAHDLLYIGMGREPLPDEIDAPDDYGTELKK